MTILSISRYSLWKNHKATTHWQVSWQMDGAKPPPPGQASWAQGRTPRTGNRQAPFVWDFCLFPFRVPRVQHPPLENRKRQFFCLPLKQAIWEQQGGFLFVMVFIGNRLIFTFKKKNLSCPQGAPSHLLNTTALIFYICIENQQQKQWRWSCDIYSIPFPDISGYYSRTQHLPHASALCFSLLDMLLGTLSSMEDLNQHKIENHQRHG